MAAHRYWRINIRSNQYGGYPGLCELSMAGLAGGPNLLTGGMASANGEADGALMNAIDGNLDSRWGAGNVFPSWWSYDFGHTVVIAEVKITARRDTVPGATVSPRDWDLQYSDDGTSWLNQDTFVSADWTMGMVQTFATTADAGGTTPAGHFYWRINIRSNQYGGYPCLAELSMAGLAGGPNLLTGGTASASGQSDGALLNAIDGDLDSRWGAGNFFPSWWSYDFRHVVVIAEVKITARRDTVPGATTAPKDWDLQYSDDGATWATKDTFVSTDWTMGMVQTFAVTADAISRARATQAALQTLAAGTPKLRVTQEAVRSVVSGTAKLRATQVALQFVTIRSVPMWITQEAAQTVARTGLPPYVMWPVRFTQSGNLLTPIPPANYLLLSLWFHLDRTDGVMRFRAGDFSLIYANGTLTLICNLGTVEWPISVGIDFDHVLLMVNGSTGQVRLRYNDTNMTGIGALTPGALTVTGLAASFGVFDPDAEHSIGCIGDWYLSTPTLFHDIDYEWNRRLFTTVYGEPIDLGVTGTVPTGEAPQIYFTARASEVTSELASNFRTNRGAAGGVFTAGITDEYDFCNAPVCVFPAPLEPEFVPYNMAIPIWSHPPDWSNGILERLEWVTSVLRSPTGAEQRRRMRLTPRRTLEMGVVLTDQERALFGLRMRSGVPVWYLPLWQEAVRVRIGLCAELLFNTVGRQLNRGDLVALFDNYSRSAVVAIGEVLPDRVRLTDWTLDDWTDGVWLIPMVFARLAGEPSMRRLTERASTGTVAFIATESNPERQPWPGDGLSLIYGGPGALTGYRVLTVPPNEVEAITESYQRLTATRDNNTGLVRVADTAGIGFGVRQYRWLVKGIAENAILRALLYTLEGRLTPVWLPSFASDLELVQPIAAADTTIVVAWVGYTDLGGPADIFLALTDGSVVICRIVGATRLGKTEVLSISGPIGRDVPIDTRVSFMTLGRQDTDVVEILHHTDIEGATSVTTIFRDAPDIRVVP